MDQALLEEMKVKHGSSNTECLHSISSQPEELGIHNVFPGLPSTGDGLVLKQSRLRPLSPAGEITRPGVLHAGPSVPQEGQLPWHQTFVTGTLLPLPLLRQPASLHLVAFGFAALQ